MSGGCICAFEMLRDDTHQGLLAIKLMVVIKLRVGISGFDICLHSKEKASATAYRSD